MKIPFLLLCSFLIFSPWQCSHAHETLILAIHPFLSFHKLHKKFSPLVSYLQEKTGRPIVIRIGSDYQEHIDAIGRDYVDIAFMGPAPYIEMTAKYGPKPILARMELNGEPFYRVNIITRMENPIRTLADLKGNTFAFVDPHSTMGYLVPSYLLNDAGVKISDLKRYDFLDNYPNVARAVLAGDFSAGAVSETIYGQFVGHGLRILAGSPPLPAHLFVARKNLPAEATTQLQEAFMALAHSEEGKSIMASIDTNMSGLIAGDDADYDVYRHMKLTLTPPDHTRKHEH